MAAKQRAGQARARQSRPAQQVPLDPRNRRNLGQFSSEKPGDYEPDPNPLEGIEFPLDGERFRCLGQLDMLDKSELALLAMSTTDTRSPQGVAMISQFLQLAFGSQEYLRFKWHVRSEKTPEETVVAILKGISEAVGVTIEAETARPTRPRSSSSPGPSATDGQVARVISLAGGEVTVVDEAEAWARGEQAAQTP